jgi:hypothetical protein
MEITAAVSKNRRLVTLGAAQYDDGFSRSTRPNWRPFRAALRRRRHFRNWREA